MTPEEWEKHRTRGIMAAFKTGRPVFADSDGRLEYVDGKREPVELASVKRSWWARFWRWLSRR